MDIQDKVIELLDRLDIDYRWVDHEPVFTVEESKKVLEEKVPIKNLFLQEVKNGQKFLVIMSGDKRLNMKDLSMILDSKKLQFGREDLLLETLGVTPGAVSLFSLLHDGSSDVEVIFEDVLLQEDELGFHPNDNTSTLFIPGPSFELIVAETGHDYRVLEL